MPIRVYLANQTFNTFIVDPSTTNNDVEKQLISKYNLTVHTPFGLYQAAEANVVLPLLRIIGCY